MLNSDEVRALGRIAATDSDVDNRIAALAVLTRLPLDTEAAQQVSAIANDLLQITHATNTRAADRRARAAIGIAARIPISTCYDPLVSIAQQKNHSLARHTALILAGRKDKAGLATLLASIDQGPSETRLKVLERLACLPLEDEQARIDPGLFDKARQDEDPDLRLWAAIALARLGDMQAFDEFWAGELGPMFWGNPWSPYNRLAAARPIPEPFNHHLEQLRQDTLEHIREMEPYTTSPELPRDLNIIYGALTGKRDAEGYPIEAESPPTRVGLDESVAANATAEELKAAEQVAEKLIVQPFQLDLPNADSEELVALPALSPQRAGEVMLSLLEKAEQKQKLQEGQPAFLFGNAIIDVADHVRHDIELPLDQLYQQYLIQSDELPLSADQFQWLISRAGAKRVVDVFGKMAELAKTSADKRRLLNWLGGVVGKLNAGPPYEGAGSESDDLDDIFLAPEDEQEMVGGREQDTGVFEAMGWTGQPDAGSVQGMGAPDDAGHRNKMTSATSSRMASARPGPTKAKTRTAWPLLLCEDAVVAGQAFELIVGIAPEQDRKLDGTGALSLPAEEVELAIELMFDSAGFALVDGRRAFSLSLTRQDPYPQSRLQLVALANDSLGARRRIGVTYLVDGVMKGYASREVVVTATEQEARQAEPTRQADRETGWRGMDLSAFMADDADLTLVIRRGDEASGHSLLFAAHSPRVSIQAPTDAPKADIGTRPEEFLREIIQKAGSKDGRDLFLWLRGRGKRIAGKLPPIIREALKRVAQAVAPQQAAVLIVTEDPYIPWELAVLDDWPDAGVIDSPFLGSQVCLGRWILSADKPPPNPPRQHEVVRKAMVSGVYDAVPGWNRLQEAEDEAHALGQRWSPMEQVNAGFDDVMDFLVNENGADAIHFALHGQFNPTGMQNGLVLIGNRQGRSIPRFLEPDHVRGGSLEKHTPFVFLNACQVAGGTELLGDYAGMAGAFLYAGASAVVAPLWSINDRIARQMAEEFYEAAYDKAQPPAEILRQCRARVTQAAIPTLAPGTAATWLGYQFFGHPRYLLKYTH